MLVSVCNSPIKLTCHPQSEQALSPTKGDQRKLITGIEVELWRVKFFHRLNLLEPPTRNYSPVDVEDFSLSSVWCLHSTVHSSLPRTRPARHAGDIVGVGVGVYNARPCDCTYIVARPGSLLPIEYSRNKRILPFLPILLFPSQTETAAYVIPHPALLWVVDDGVESM